MAKYNRCFPSPWFCSNLPGGMRPLHIAINALKVVQGELTTTHRGRCASKYAQTSARPCTVPKSTPSTKSKAWPGHSPISPHAWSTGVGKTIPPDHAQQHPPHAKSRSPCWARRSPGLEAAAAGLRLTLGSGAPSQRADHNFGAQ